MFRGYVKTVDKECTMKFANVPDKELLNLQEASELSEYAGILAKETVLIDIDEHEQSEILMDIVEDLQLRCRVYQTTRGKHFLFKNVINSDDQYLFNKAVIHAHLACGLIADIKLGCKNGYEILKFNDKDRPIIYDKLEDEDYQEAPKWLVPVNSKVDFANLEEGDGRNDTIWKYILTLQTSGFSKKEARECLTLINKYVMKDSLSEKELNVIMRDGAFKKEIFFNDKKQFLFDKFSNYLMNAACIRRINDSLHIYKDGIYISGYDWIEREMIKNIPNLKDKDRKEVIKYLNLIVPGENTSSAYNIAFANGVYNLTDDTIGEFSSDIIMTNKIPFNYNPTAYSEIADKTLNKLANHDKKTRLLLEEAIGYCFFRRNELRKSFWLIGDKKNGKSTFLQMVSYVVGDENRSAVDLPDIISNGFRAFSMYNKLINVCDDIDDDYIKKTGVLKKVISGSEIQLRNLYSAAISYTPYTKIFISANEYPRINDKTGAVIDRIVSIPFNNTFSPDDPDYDPFINTKLMTREVAEYLINIGIAGLKRVLGSNMFTEPDCVKQSLEEFNEKNNPILLFFKATTIDDVLNQPTQEVYLSYNTWCLDNGFQALSNVEFSRQTKKYYGLDIKVKKLDGKSYRIFVKN